MNADAVMEGLAAEPNLYGLPGTWCWDNSDAPGAAARLHCYAGKTKWLLVGEELYFDQDNWGQHEGFMHVLHCYGTAAHVVSHIFSTVVADGDAPLFAENEDGPIDPGINPSATTVRIRNIVVAIPRDPAFLEKHAIRVVGNRFEGDSLYRALCSVTETRQLLLAEPDEIRRALGIHQSLEPVLMLDDWASPQLNEDFPNSECARLLAEVIAHRDPKRYKPTEASNMHWRHRFDR